MITGDRARMMAMIQSAADDAIAKAEVAGEMTPAKAMASLQEEWLAGGMNARSKKAAPAPAAVSQDSAGAPSPARKSLTSMLTGSSSRLSSAPALLISPCGSCVCGPLVAPASATPAASYRWTCLYPKPVPMGRRRRRSPVGKLIFLGTGACACAPRSARTSSRRLAGAVQ